MSNSVKTLNLDGQAFDVATLSDEARVQVNNIVAADAEIARLQQQLAFVQTARNAYMFALKQALPAAEAGEEKPKATRKRKA